MQIEEERENLLKKQDMVQKDLDAFTNHNPKPHMLTPRKRRAWNSERKLHTENQRKGASANMTLVFVVLLSQK